MPSVNETTEYKDESTGSVEMHITDLMFDERIADMIEKRNGCFPVALLRNLYSSGAFKLNDERLDRILEGYDSGAEIPPINIKKGFDTYTVVNGSHRICAALLKDRTTIRCIINE